MIVAVLLGPALGCTSAREDDPVTTELAASLDDLPTGTAGYELALDSAGDEPRALLVGVFPVGQRSSLSVDFDGGPEIELDATVTAAAADGSSQRLILEITGVNADDGAERAALGAIVGSSLQVERDGRGAVVGFEFDIPAALGVRADGLARRGLEAPLLLAGPVPTVALGPGAAWEIVVRDESGEVASRTLSITDLGDGTTVVEVSGDAVTGTLLLDASRLLPLRQTFTLDGTTVVVEAR